MSDKNFINSLPPKSAFKVGLVSGLMISFVIGFFILLSFVIDKDDNIIHTELVNEIANEPNYENAMKCI